MADFFNLRKRIKKYDDEASVIEMLKTIVEAHEKGLTSCPVGYPTGLSIDLINMIRSFGFKAHTIDLKDPNNSGAKTTIIQW